MHVFTWLHYSDGWNPPLLLWLLLLTSRLNLPILNLVLALLPCWLSPFLRSFWTTVVPSVLPYWAKPFRNRQLILMSSHSKSAATNSLSWAVDDRPVICLAVNWGGVGRKCCWLYYPRWRLLALPVSFCSFPVPLQCSTSGFLSSPLPPFSVACWWPLLCPRASGPPRPPAPLGYGTVPSGAPQMAACFAEGQEQVTLWLLTTEGTGPIKLFYPESAVGQWSAFSGTHPAEEPHTMRGLRAIVWLQFILEDCSFLSAEVWLANASQELAAHRWGWKAEPIPKPRDRTLLVGNLFAQYICYHLSYPNKLCEQCE